MMNLKEFLKQEADRETKAIDQDIRIGISYMVIGCIVLAVGIWIML